ncbi:MAG: tryptophan--tRNA ligase [Candidatus Omnitrophica bacterium]|nr:tryptophan--tRNA ligase [Candidatus Omnitrophota bacterium]
MNKKIILSGMRPTGKLHLGHWVGALSNWVSLQETYQCFFMIADWHALMSEYKNSSAIKENIFDNICDWLAYGIDPKKATIFIQSDVTEHLELYIILSALTPLGWLYRCPTFKEQINQLKDKEINTYAFLGYPILQAADILLYKADYVPVGEDQLPHLELTREIVRRFHNIYQKGIFKEPQPLLTPMPRLVGLDGRKMSKSYNNYIALDEEDNQIKTKILSMFTDPLRIRISDPGHPQDCNVYSYYCTFFDELKTDVYEKCITAKRGCVECKEILAKKIIEIISTKREKKKKFLKKKELVYDILNDGRKEAKRVASLTIKEVKEIIGFNYF